MTCRVTIRNSSGTGPDKVGTCWKMVTEEGQGSAQGLEHPDLQRSSVKTDLGGAHASRTVEEGAETPVHDKVVQNW